MTLKSYEAKKTRIFIPKKTENPIRQEQQVDRNNGSPKNQQILKKKDMPLNYSLEKCSPKTDQNYLNV